MEKRDFITELVDALRCLPGIGPRSAQRMAYHLLLGKREKGLHLADSLKKAMEGVLHCRRCHNFSVSETCSLCLDKTRDLAKICVVEMPTDVLAMEETGVYKGRYFVLMGHLSPLDGIGPKQLGIDKLTTLIDEGEINEVIFALNPTIEGEATIHYLQEVLTRPSLVLSRLAHGVPVGSELEYLDTSTIGHALLQRSQLAES